MIIEIILFILLVISYIVDGKARKKMYITDVNLARVQARKDFNVRAERFEKTVNEGWENMIKANNFRYGIVGDIDFDIHPNDRFQIVGAPTFVSTGIIVDKKYVSRDDIVNDMAKFTQISNKKFVASSDELRERYIVLGYSQDNLKQFTWDDEGLFRNVDVGDEVSISYDKSGINTIGYKIKGERNAAASKGNVDMGTDKKISRERGDKG